MNDKEYDEFVQWLNRGIDMKWISSPVCATHNGLPNTEEEENEWEEGYDPCVIGLRVWVQ